MLIVAVPTTMDNIVWVRDGQEGFILAKMTELMDDGAEVIPMDPKFVRRTCGFDEIYPCGDYKKEYDDNCTCPSCSVVAKYLLIFKPELK